MPDLAAQVENALAGEILAGRIRRVRVRNSAFPAAPGLLGAAALARLGKSGAWH